MHYTYAYYNNRLTQANMTILSHSFMYKANLNTNLTTSKHFQKPNQLKPKLTRHYPCQRADVSARSPDAVPHWAREHHWRHH